MRVLAVNKPFSCGVCGKTYSTEELAKSCENKPSRGEFSVGDLVLALGEDQSRVVSKITYDDAGHYHTQRLYFDGISKRNGNTAKFFRKVSFKTGDKVKIRIMNDGQVGATLTGFGLVKGYNFVKGKDIKVVVDVVECHFPHLNSVWDPIPFPVESVFPYDEIKDKDKL